MATSSIPLILFLLPLALLTVGAVLLSIGLRGRAIDNHPICRRCGFDLFGLDTLVKCPECGTELSARDIRLGHRRVRKLPLTFGLAMLIPSLVILAGVMFAVVKQVDVNRYKPVWWLLREADSPALVELNRRLGANRLDAGQIDRIIATALAAQADSSRPFLVEWGIFVEAARAAGKVGDESWTRYARQAVPLKLVARANVRRGDPLPVRVDYGPVRLGRGYQFRSEIQLVQSALNGVPLSGTTRANMPVQFSDRGKDLYVSLQIPPDSLPGLSDGAATLKVTLRVTMQERGTVRETHMVSQDVELSTSVNLVPADRPTVEVLNDPALRAGVESSLVLRGFRTPRVFTSFSNGAGGRFVHLGKDYWGNDRAEFLIEAKNPPTGVAGDVAVLDRAGREWPLDTIAIDAGSQNSGWVLSGHWDGFNADRVDVVLRPNPAVAVKTVGITQIWGGAIRFRDVPVVWDKEAARPTTLPASMRAKRPTTTRATTTTRSAP